MRAYLAPTAIMPATNRYSSADSPTRVRLSHCIGWILPTFNPWKREKFKAVFPPDTRQLGMGKTNEEIGINLGLAANTIKKQLQIIFGKLGVEHRTAAALYAREFFPSAENTSPFA